MDKTKILTYHIVHIDGHGVDRYRRACRMHEYDEKHDSLIAVADSVGTNDENGYDYPWPSVLRSPES